MNANSKHSLKDAFDRANNKAKDKSLNNQLKTIFRYLREHVATASMVADATGVPQKNICRYKRDLEKAGILYEVKKVTCKVTGFKAWYLTTNPAEVAVKQYKLFNDEWGE